MFRYLRAAFLVRPSIPALGRVPINLLGLTAFGILGFGNPAFWLLGIGLETAFVTLLATNSRFQQLVDALDMKQIGDDSESKRASLVEQLSNESKHRLKGMESRCARVVEVLKKQGVEDYTIDSSSDALDRLKWLYLKLLLAQDFLKSSESLVTESELRDQIKEIDKQLALGKLSPSVRESKTATRDILTKRLENLERREQSLAAIDSDLTRIDAQVDLAVENALMSTQPPAVSSNITLASHLLEPSVFGSSERMVAEMDQAYEEAAATSTPSTPNGSPPAPGTNTPITDPSTPAKEQA